jgi:pimeloyl-ACP methyl ester carboxylesterase
MKACISPKKLNYFLMGVFLLCELEAHSQNTTHLADTIVERFVNIGNHKLLVRERESRDARFTVVFESGAGGSSQDWLKVIPLLGAEIRIIAYDRAGLGKSEAGPVPQTMAQSVFELHKLIEAINIKGPVILVGQSMGGLLIRLYTEQYGKNVVGLVLVDPAHESGVFGSMKYGGWTRLREKATGKPIPRPQVNTNISAGYDSTADYLAEEFQNIYLAGQKNAQPLGNRPVVILGAGIRNPPPGTPDEQWKVLRTERDKQVEGLAVLSNNSRFIADPKSTHHIQKDNPEIVAQAIQMVINSITANAKL